MQPKGMSTTIRNQMVKKNTMSAILSGVVKIDFALIHTVSI
jgi:hypothetical protein